MSLSTNVVSAANLTRRNINLLTSVSEAFQQAEDTGGSITGIRVNPTNWQMLQQDRNHMIIGSYLPDDGKQHIFGTPVLLDPNVRLDTAIVAIDFVPKDPERRP